MDETTTIEESPGRGTAYYQRLGHLGGTACKRNHGTKHYHDIGALGGKATKERLGPEHYARIGRKGNKAAYENWLEAKKAEAPHG